MLAFVRLHARKIVSLLVMLAIMWRWDPAVHPLAASAPVDVPGAKIDVSAKAILERMTRVYAMANSYRDKGVVRITWSGWSSHTSQFPFETAFVREGGFRFEYTDQKERSLLGLLLNRDDRMVVWGDNHNVKTWWTIEPGKVDAEPLDRALAGAYGVSARSSGTIPGMLVHELGYAANIDQVDDPVVVGIESFRSHECYRVKGNWSRREQELWIDRESYLLRRTHEVSETDGKSVDHITAYDPEINVDIPDEAFRLEPPK